MMVVVSFSVTLLECFVLKVHLILFYFCKVVDILLIVVLFSLPSFSSFSRAGYFSGSDKGPREDFPLGVSLGAEVFWRNKCSVNEWTASYKDHVIIGLCILSCFFLWKQFLFHLIKGQC